MSQKDFLRDFDSRVFSSFAAAGMADPLSRYLPKGGGATVPCTVMVDRNVQSFGDDPMPVAAYDTAVTFQRIEVVPEKGGIVEADGDRFVLTEKLLDDGSLVRWAVTRG